MKTLLVLLAIATSATARPITVEDLMKVRSIVDVRISPDGERVAYVVSTPSVEKNEHETELRIVRADGSEPKRVGDGVRIFNMPMPAPRLRWTPDSESVAVLGFAGDRPQVFAIPLAGGEARQLTDAAEGVSRFEFSPDGTRIAYLSRDPAPAERPIVVHAGAPDRPQRVFVGKLGEAARAITPIAHYVDGFSWSPEGEEIAYSAASRGGFTALYDTRVWVVASSGGEPRVVVGRAGMNTRPQFSPDGNLLAFISSNGRVSLMAPRSLTIVPARGGAPRLHPMNDAWANEIVWAPDSKSVYVTTNDGTFGRGERMFDQPIVRVNVESGSAQRVPAGGNAIFALSISNEGRLAYRGVEPRTMGEVFVDATRITDANPELREFDLGELRPVKWKSFDGMEIWGLLLTPSNAAAGTRLPLLVYVHGGPGGGVTWGLFPQFMQTIGHVDPYPTAAFAGAGYAVLFPMPRGGAGYGEAGQRAIVNAWGEADYRDIMLGVDAMIERGIADPDRLGVMGASYGGYMTNWIVTQTGRFKAASAGASISDLSDPYYLTDAGDYMAEYFGKPWENRASYVAHSPLTFAENVTTPLLIQHGERDPRAPIAGAWKFYRALDALDKTVELDVYPTGSHVMYAPALQRDVMRRNFEWFLKWIPAN
ncbi:MAG: LpqB family beta-propeller domain-containing protein [Thermoanaerobaculia bacterium]